MGKLCEIYTTIPWMMKYLEKMVIKFPDECRMIKDDQYSYTAQIPFKLVKPRNPRVMTEEQKKKMADHLANARKQRKW